MTFRQFNWCFSFKILQSTRCIAGMAHPNYSQNHWPFNPRWKFWADNCLYPRKTQLSHSHGPVQSLDARHILQKWEGGQEAWDNCAQRLCPDLSQRRYSLQYKVSKYSAQWFSLPLFHLLPGQMQIMENLFSFSRISLTLACPMDLRLYPLDKQVCVLQIASCKYCPLKY